MSLIFSGLQRRSEKKEEENKIYEYLDKQITTCTGETNFCLCVKFSCVDCSLVVVVGISNVSIDVTDSCVNSVYPLHSRILHLN